MEQNYSNVQERTDILNKNAQNRSVLDSIDRPIRPLIIELNSIGLITVFSCCGYTYEGQEEPKTHQTGPYVIFRVNEEDVYSVKNFFRLASIVNTFGWGIWIAANGYEWCLCSSPADRWPKSDNLTEPIHEYELKLIHIVKLTKALKKFPSHNGEFTIKDGNEQRRSIYGIEWMVAPKKAETLDANKIYSEGN